MWENDLGYFMSFIIAKVKFKDTERLLNAGSVCHSQKKDLYYSSELCVIFYGKLLGDPILRLS